VADWPSRGVYNINDQQVPDFLGMRSHEIVPEEIAIKGTESRIHKKNRFVFKNERFFAVFPGNRMRE
jgi:hypothetical protein